MQCVNTRYKIPFFKCVLPSFCEIPTGWQAACRRRVYVLVRMPRGRERASERGGITVMALSSSSGTISHGESSLLEATRGEGGTCRMAWGMILLGEFGHRFGSLLIHTRS